MAALPLTLLLPCSFCSWSEKQTHPTPNNPTGGSAPDSDLPSCSFSSEECVFVRGEAHKGGGIETVLPSKLTASITHGGRLCPEGLDQPFLPHDCRGGIYSPVHQDPLTPANHQLPLFSQQPGAGSSPGPGSPGVPALALFTSLLNRKLL